MNYIFVYKSAESRDEFLKDKIQWLNIDRLDKSFDELVKMYTNHFSSFELNKDTITVTRDERVLNFVGNMIQKHQYFREHFCIYYENENDSENILMAWYDNDGYIINFQSGYFIPDYLF